MSPGVGISAAAALSGAETGAAALAMFGVATADVTPEMVMGWMLGTAATYVRGL